MITIFEDLEGYVVFLDFVLDSPFYPQWLEIMRDHGLKRIGEIWV